MKKFIVAIEENIVQEFQVEAENEKEALDLIVKKYENHEVVVENGELQHKQVAIIEPLSEKKEVEWYSF